MEATLFGSAAGPDSRGPVALRPRIAPGLPFREVVSQSICIPNSTQEADIAASNVRRNIRADDHPHPVGPDPYRKDGAWRNQGEILSSIPGISGEDRRCFRRMGGLGR